MSGLSSDPATSFHMCWDYKHPLTHPQRRGLAGPGWGPTRADTAVTLMEGLGLLSADMVLK